ncbi:MAG: SLC13 family permease [Anaerolineaceae bacterium]|nr:SLC13 family permease [Anaerolineaceae bacterium]
MTAEMGIVLAILAIAIALFVTEKLRVDIVAIGVVIALMLSGTLTAEEALAGFSSTTVLTIASLFIVGGAVFQTGLASQIANRILKIAGTNETKLIIVVMITVALLSGIMSDTGVVAVMLPAIVALAVSAKLSVSKLLIPLAYGALLGGATTLIGTPPNIIVSEVLTENGLATFTFFSYTPIGLIMIVVGIVFMLLIGKRLLPDHKPAKAMSQMETPAELFELYRLPDNLFRVRVRGVSPLAGQPIATSRLRQDFGVNIIEIKRAAQPAGVMPAIGRQRLARNGNGDVPVLHHPGPDTILQPEDILIVQGEGNDVGRAAGYWNLAIQANDKISRDDFINHEVGIAEVLLRPRSTLLGKSLSEIRFGSTYHLTVLDIKRPGVDERLNLKSTPLKMGDTLLVQGTWQDIFALKRLRHDFIVMGEPEAINVGAFTRQEKAPIALFILLAMVVLLVLDVLPLVIVGMVAALAAVLTGCLTMDDAYEAIDWRSIVLIAGMLPMSTALVKVGLVDLISSGFIQALGTLGPLAVMGGLFLLTSAFTQVLSNTATAVLVAPIALATAQGIGVQPQAFLMAVALAASMAFASPVASPVNTLVMGAGRYRFFDYIRIGVPMIVMNFVIVMIVLPLLFPF